MIENKDLELTIQVHEDRENEVLDSVFITNFTLLLIANALSRSISLNLIEVESFFASLPCSTELEKFISFNDRRFLYIVDYILKNKDNSIFVKEVRNYFKKRAEISNKRYVRKVSDTPKYHANSNCSFLISDFENFLIPEDVVAKGEEAVHEFRKQFHSKNYDRSNRKIIFDMGDALEKVQAPNSGHHEYSSMNDFIQGLIFKIQKACSFLKENPELQTVKYAPTYKIKTITNSISSIAVEFHQEHKKKIMDDLINLILRNNEDSKEWDRQDLEKMGFTPCKMCE